MADGSQLRRRVRMATADEPVDTNAIANQAASELRQQIEASPIGERLDRVVQEDRPLASRTISAETPLVEEPDDSPSAREISFGPASVGSRFARRSLMDGPAPNSAFRDDRTPEAAATALRGLPDLTGIEPEAEVRAKPEPADADILEPDQPDRSPAGPDRDATAQGEATDEFQALHKAQQHDRRARIGAGVLRGVQALASMIGGAANIPGLSALGGLANVSAGVIPQGAGVADFEQRHALSKEATQARQRAEQQAYERGQDAMAADRAERQLAVNVSNAESGQENARASRDMQNRLNETRLQEYQAENDPNHQAARTARGVFSAFLDAAAREKPELREDFADVTENLENMSASEIRGAIDQLKIFRNAPAGARRTRGGRGPGGGTPSQPAAVDFSSPEQIAIYEDALRRAAAATNNSIEYLRGRYPIEHMYEDSARSLSSLLTTQGARDVDREQQLATQDQTMIVPGWSRTPNAPRLQPGAAQDARERVATFNTLSVYAQQMMNLANRVDAMQRAGASAGVLSREVARGRHIHEQLISALRTIGNYGVPNGTELQRMESLAPRLDSVDGLLNARNLYDGMRRTIWTGTLNKMRADGYAPERRAR